MGQSSITSFVLVIVAVSADSTANTNDGAVALKAGSAPRRNVPKLRQFNLLFIFNNQWDWRNLATTLRGTDPTDRSTDQRPTDQPTAHRSTAIDSRAVVVSRAPTLATMRNGIIIWSETPNKPNEYY